MTDEKYEPYDGEIVTPISLRNNETARLAWSELVSTRFGLAPDDVVVWEAVDRGAREVPRLVVGRGWIRLECRLYLHNEAGHRYIDGDELATHSYVRTIRLELGESIDVTALW